MTRAFVGGPLDGLVEEGVPMPCRAGAAVRSMLGEVVEAESPRLVCGADPMVALYKVKVAHWRQYEVQHVILEHVGWRRQVVAA